MKDSRHTQIMAGYFRTWRDKAADPATNQTSMDELPESVDIAIVFPWDTPPDNPFWEALRTRYVPALRARGTKVVITQGIEGMLDAEYADTPEGHQAYVDMIMNTYIRPFDLDGLDIDYERSLSEVEYNKVVSIFNLLAKELGPESGTGKLLILDTNGRGGDPLFKQLEPKIDYLFLQVYGQPLSVITPIFELFSAYLPANKFLLGFSFYEEQGARWNDVNEDRNSGRAFDYANWQPADGQCKGGIFSYAIDRDIPGTTDDILAADFVVTERLVEIMNKV
jgi:hypothetical protein